MVGVMNEPSNVFMKIQMSGATKASMRLGKVRSPTTKNLAIVTAGPRYPYFVSAYTRLCGTYFRAYLNSGIPFNSSFVAFGRRILPFPPALKS